MNDLVVAALCQSRRISWNMVLNTLLEALSGWARANQGDLARAAALGDELVALVDRLCRWPDGIRPLDLVQFETPVAQDANNDANGEQPLLTEETPEMLAAVGACVAAAAVSLINLSLGRIGRGGRRRQEATAAAGAGGEQPPDGAGATAAARQQNARLAWHYVRLGRRCVGQHKNFALEFAAARMYEAAGLELKAWQHYNLVKDLLAKSELLRQDPRWGAVLAALTGAAELARGDCAARVTQALVAQCCMTDSREARLLKIKFKTLENSGVIKDFEDFAKNVLDTWDATKVLKRKFSPAQKEQVLACPAPGTVSPCKLPARVKEHRFFVPSHSESCAVLLKGVFVATTTVVFMTHSRLQLQRPIGEEAG